MKELVLLFTLTSLVTAQEFEVAVIRPAVEDHNATVNADNGYYVVHNLTLKRLIATTWGVDGSEVIGGPAWIGSDQWDINAKIPEEYAKHPVSAVLYPEDSFLRTMIRNLLADRFRLTVHRETRQVSGYGLILAKNGSKMTAAKPGESDTLQGNNHHLKAVNMRMQMLARILSGDRDIGKLVVDQTGLTGGYDFEIEWATADDSSSDHPSVFTALQEQLGLKLEAATVPIQAVIIDRVEKPNKN